MEAVKAFNSERVSPKTLEYIGQIVGSQWKDLIKSKSFRIPNLLNKTKLVHMKRSSFSY